MMALHAEHPAGGTHFGVVLRRWQRDLDHFNHAAPRVPLAAQVLQSLLGPRILHTHEYVLPLLHVQLSGLRASHSAFA